MGSAHLRDVTIERTLLAQGCGWQVSDVTFRATAAGARFESRHDGVAIAAVTAGSFRYRSSRGCVTLMPGALMLGNAGDEFECSYDGTWGDRCISFGYTCDYFERIAGEPETRTAPDFTPIASRRHPPRSRSRPRSKPRRAARMRPAGKSLRCASQGMHCRPPVAKRPGRARATSGASSTRSTSSRRATASRCRSAPSPARCA